MRANMDVAGQNITLCIRDVKNLSEIIRKNLALANDKERSVGVLCEQLYESCSAAAQLQLSTVQSALMGFACTLQRIELQRQALFQRIAPLSANALLISSRNTQAVGQALQKRELAIKKAQNLPPARAERSEGRTEQPDPDAGRVAKPTGDAGGPELVHPVQHGPQKQHQGIRACANGVCSEGA